MARALASRDLDSNHGSTIAYLGDPKKVVYPF